MLQLVISTHGYVKLNFLMTNETWQTIQQVGYEGKQKDSNRQLWNATFGAGNWRLVWQYANGKLVGFDGVFEEYVLSYTNFFSKNLPLARRVSESYSYTYDKDPIPTKTEAFTPLARVNIPGVANQFHHVALNIALEQRCNLPFQGEFPVQVRLDKPGLPELSPSHIPCIHPDLIPADNSPGEVWWQPGSVEELYQNSKVLQIKVTT